MKTFPSQNNGLEKFMFPNLKKILKLQNKKKTNTTMIQRMQVYTQKMS